MYIILSIASQNKGKLVTSIFWITKCIWSCSKTTLTGESWFHIRPPRGFEPGSLVTGSKQVVSPLNQ
jgi:hypothetical protein